jgi:hypothetical protein
LADDPALPDREAMAVFNGRAAGGRPDRGDPAKSRGNTQTAAKVIAQAERRGASGDERGFAAGAAAAGSFEIPRVIGPSEERIIGFDEEEKLRPREKTLWYYRSLADKFRERWPGQLANELHEIIEVLEE